MLADDLAGLEPDGDRLAVVRRDRDLQRNRATRLEVENHELRQALGLLHRLEEARPDPPQWLAPPKSTKKHHATLLLALSDMHFDEVVNPSEVGGINAYNRDIAVLRLQQWAEVSVSFGRDYLAGFHYDGAVVCLGGDSFSGDIHEELSQTNADTILGSVLFWSEQLAAALGLVAAELGKVHVVAVPGNHGRMSRKPRSKLRARTNFDWLLAKMLERYFANDNRFTFDIPEDVDAEFGIYGHRFLLNHGETSGGGGIGGIWPPIMRLRARKMMSHRFDTMVIGHWHQYTPTPGMIINGSVKGYDEYARTAAFAPEVPQQALIVVAPERGIIHQAPIFCAASRKKEGW